MKTLALALLCSRLALAGDAGSAAASTLKVASWNILAGDRGLEGIVAVLRTLNADLIGLQEVDMHVRRSGRVDQPAALGRALGYQSAFGAHFPFQGGEYGVALLSRFPLEEVQVHRPPGSRLCFLSATVRAPQGRVKVVVVHFTVTLPGLSAPAQLAKDASRLAEANQLAELAASWKLPTIVLGDFNTPAGSEAYQVVARVLRDACASKPDARTWNSRFPVRRIDYVWHSAALLLEECDTVPTEASDHLPVWSRLEWSPAAGAPGSR